MYHRTGIFVIICIHAVVCGCDRTEPDAPALSNAGLSGERVHDFGEVDLVAAITRVEHDFVLLNKNSHVMRVDSTRSTCGCTIAEVIPTEIAPGSELRVRTSLKISSAGGKQERVWVIFGSGEIEEFVVKANGRRVFECFADGIAIPLHEQVTGRLILTVIHGGGAPPAPLLTLPNGIVAQIAPWAEVSIPGSQSPARRFQCAVTLDRLSSVIPDTAVATIQLGQWEPITVGLTGKPW